MVRKVANIDVEPAQLAEFCKAQGVSRLLVFGSALRDDFAPERSDVDLLVEFVPGATRGLFKLLQMQEALGRLFGRKVDLTTPASLSKYFRDDAIASAVVLYDAA